MANIGAPPQTHGPGALMVTSFDCEEEAECGVLLAGRREKKKRLTGPDRRVLGGERR